MSDDVEHEEEEDSPWGLIGFGLVLIAAGVGLYFWFDHIEQEGGRIRMHVLVILLYEWLGKLGVLGVLGGIGTLMTLVGLKGLLSGD